jgi:hypothetical protein
MAYNAIMSISFHTRDHAHVLKCIDDAKKKHPTMTRSAIVRSLIIDGTDVTLMKQLLDQHVSDWRKEYMELIRKSQGQT